MFTGKKCIANLGLKLEKGIILLIICLQYVQNKTVVLWDLDAEGPIQLVVKCNF